MVFAHFGYLDDPVGSYGVGAGFWVGTARLSLTDGVLAASSGSEKKNSPE